MHGLINRSLQCYLRDTFGVPTWMAIAQQARLGFDTFEPMLRYDPSLTEAVLDTATALLQRPRDAILEDYGTYLVSHANLEPLRRLLRFSGVTFCDFLLSLEDMKGRGRLALPDLDLPELELTEAGDDRYCLRCQSIVPGAAHVILGLLRAMADDYGALALLDHAGRDPDGREAITIHVLDTGFAQGRAFDLSAGMA